MTDPDFNALVARLQRPIDVSTVGADINALIAHTTRLRAAVSVILRVDPGLDNKSSRAHLKALVGESDET